MPEVLTEIDIVNEKDLPIADKEAFKKVWNGMTSIRRNLNIGVFRATLDREPTDVELALGFDV
jgi:hypothetical protein